MNATRYVSIAFVCLSLISNGCSMVGLTILTNASTEENVYNSNTQNFMLIDSGKAIHVITSDSNIIEGKFINFSQSVYEDYLSRYEEARKQLNSIISLPELGNKIVTKRKVINVLGNQIAKIQLKEWDSKFYGFDFGGVLLSDSDYNNAIAIPIENLNEATMENGNHIDFERIKFFLQENYIPLVSKLNIIHNDNPLSIPSENIREIKTAKSTSLETILFIISLGIDGVILAQDGYTPILAVAGNLITLPIFLLTLIP